MGFFDKLKEPVFLKETSDLTQQLDELQSLLITAPKDVIPEIEKQINQLTYGKIGEDRIAFELKNSHIPMYVLHDIFLESNGLTSQIDFLVITRERNFVIECKNLYGDIEINSNGDFIRTMRFRGRTTKEGIYSPITQIQRHMELIKEIRSDSKTNMFMAKFFEKYFDENYKSVVILANEKTILNSKYAKKEIKEKVIRADQLIEHIKSLNGKSDFHSSDKDMNDLAQFFLVAHAQNKVDYNEKYRKLCNVNDNLSIEAIKTIEEPSIEIEELRNELKAYRLKQSREEKVAPYFLFNNRQMDDLLAMKPKTINELTKISGFGEVKCQKYGPAILEIIKKYDGSI